MVGVQDDDDGGGVESAVAGQRWRAEAPLLLSSRGPAAALEQPVVPHTAVPRHRAAAAAAAASCPGNRPRAASGWVQQQQHRHQQGVSRV